MKNLFASIGCVVVLKKAFKLYRKYRDLKHYKKSPHGH